MVALCTFIVGIFMAFEPITDNDWFWHVVVGKWIDINHAIPNKELFSWLGTKNNLPWVSHEWLTEWIMYKIGPVGCIVIMLLIFIGLYYLMSKMLKINFKKFFDFKYIYLLLMCVFFKVTGPRPYIISLLFFAYLIYILFEYIDNKNPIFNKLIWTLPILQIIWVNFHGGSSSMIYIFIIGVLLCQLLLKILPFSSERWGSDILSTKQIKTLLFVLITVLLASLLNPQTYNMLLYPFTNMADNSMLSNILEWESPSFHGLLGVYIFVMIAFPLFNMIMSKDKFKLHEVAFLGLFLFMCLKSQRFVGMYGIYSTWLVGKYFFITDDMYEKIREIFKKHIKIITYVFIAGIILITIGVGLIQFKKFNTIIDNDGFYSDEAIKTVIKLKPERLYNDYGQGGYLLYKLDEFNELDNIKVFGYGLGDVFSSNILPDSQKLSKMTGNPSEIIEKYDFDVILTTSYYPLHYYLDEREDYKLAYSDKMALVYVKKAS